jgi:hypothetical protein
MIGLGTLVLAVYILALSPVHAKSKPNPTPTFNEEIVMGDDEMEALSYADNEPLPKNLQESESSEEKKEYINKE